MESTEFYDAVMVKSREHSIDFDFLYTAVLCLKNNLNATPDDICRDFLQRGELFYPGVSDGKGPVSPVFMSTIENEAMFIKGIRFYLPPGATVLKYHAAAYQKLRSLFFQLDSRFNTNGEVFDAGKIVKALCIELILPINYELPGAN